MNFNTLSKSQKLLLGLVFDAIGFIPMLDVVWAPLSAFLMIKMYKGNTGKIAGAIVFIEEALPFLDVIPTFTLMWLYTYVFSKSSSKDAIILSEQ